MGAVLLGAVPLVALVTTTLPAELQVALFSKILSYDRKLATRAGESITIGLLYQDRYPASKRAADDLALAYKASQIRTIADVAITVVLLSYRDRAELREQLRQRAITVLYIAPLRGTDVSEIVQEATAQQVLTLTSTAGDVERGVAVGLELRGGKPLIRVNLPMARAQGADFSSQLLKLAEVVER